MARRNFGQGQPQLCPDPGDGVGGRPENCTDPPQALLSDPAQLTGFSADSVF
jgi:hypothetical protein